MTFGQRLRFERKSRKLSQEELAKVLDTTKQAIYKYETGVVQNIPFDKLAKLADYFGVTSAYLMGWTDERDGVIPTIAPEPEEDAAPELPAALREAIRPVSAIRLPMLGNVACGEPIYAEEEHEFCVALAADGRGIDADFCLTASGDSMINARIFDGDILFIRKQEIVDNGYDPVYGARPLKRYMQRALETALAKAILAGKFKAGDEVIVDTDDNGLVIR